jgi:hypothetical protein
MNVGAVKPRLPVWKDARFINAQNMPPPQTFLEPTKTTNMAQEVHTK